MYSDIAIPRQAYNTEEHQMLQAALDEFIKKEVHPNYEEWEKNKMVPRSFWQKMGEQGFLCMDMPEQYGGGGLDFSFSALVLERCRYQGLDFGIAVHSDIVAPYINRYGTDAQKQKFIRPVQLKKR